MRAPDTFMLMWFTNPHMNPSDDGTINNGIATQLFPTLEQADEMAKLLDGNKVILSGFKNGDPETNIFWDVVKEYGGSFDLSHRINNTNK